MAVNRFNNPLRQRLVAAGAQPERADKFVETAMFEKGMEMPAASVGVKPTGTNEWYDEEYWSASEAVYPTGFRAPRYGQQGFDKYFDYVFGRGSYSNLTKPAQINLAKAPTYAAAKRSQDALDIGTVSAVESGATLPQVVSKFRTQFRTDPTIAGGMTEKEAVSYITDVWNEYNKFVKGAEAEDLQALVDKRVKSNKNFQYGMPDPRLRYGMTTNFDSGTVDVLQNPGAKSAYDAYAKKVGNDPRQLAAYKQALVKAINQKRQTPWSDEAKRRDSLKGAKFGG